MREINKKTFVYMGYRNERGFTFMHVILTLMVVSITMPFIVYLFQFITTESDDDEIAVLQFFIFLRNDALTAEAVSSNNDVIYFDLTNGEIAKIEQFNDVIRRQVEGRGHEIYARNIKDFKLVPLSYGTHVYVTTIEGNTYDKIIAHY